MQRVVTNLTLNVGIRVNDPKQFTPNDLDSLFQTFQTVNGNEYDIPPGMIPVYAYLVPIDRSGTVYLETFQQYTGAGKFNVHEWFRGDWCYGLYDRKILQPSAIFDTIVGAKDTRFMEVKRSDRVIRQIYNDQFDDIEDDAREAWLTEQNMPVLDTPLLYYVTYIQDEDNQFAINRYHTALMIYVVAMVDPNDPNAPDWNPMRDKNRVSDLIDYERPRFIPENQLRMLNLVDLINAHFSPIASKFVELIEDNKRDWYLQLLEGVE